MKDKSEILPSKRPPRRSPPRDRVGEHVDPSISSSNEDSETLSLAIKQTLSARATLYWPSKELREELALAAKGLMGYLNFLETQEDGDMLVIGLCARLLGPEGLDPQDFFLEVIENKGIVEDPKKLAKLCLHTLEGHLLGVEYGHEGPELGHSRAVTIALLGDVGAFTTHSAPATGTVRTKEVHTRLKESFSDYALQLEDKSSEYRQLVDQSTKRARKFGGGEIVGPTKSKERTRVEEESIPRTGIHDCGKDVDELLGRFEKEGHLVPTKWSAARLHEKRVETIQEPLAGHMSASPSEILWTWDILAGRGLDSAYTGNPDKETDFFSPARAGGTCAFLIGCGYHSALEVLHGTMLYVGQDLQHVLPEAVEIREKETGFKEPLDAGTLFHSGAATSLVEDLLDDMTSTVGRETKSSIKIVQEEKPSIEMVHKEQVKKKPVVKESVEPKVSAKKKPMWQILSDLGFESVAVPIFRVAHQLEELSKKNPKQAIKSGEEYLDHKTHKKNTEYVRKIQSFVDHLKMEQLKQVKNELHKFKEEQNPKHDKDSQFKV
ncbi:hypothetical protein [Legionella sainthelensi]|uniref:hypothetical protein n=1 Tax=Legionella sainthelensi TaxID=28087 RepID=UPI000E1FE56A|nr:hypothetical protein [Legionella sainthelensi]